MTAAAVFGVMHVELAVSDIARARRLYVDTLGFTPAAEWPGAIDLDAGGTVLLRLIESARPEQRGALRIRVASVEATLAALQQAGCALAHAPMRTDAAELQASLRDPDGHGLTVWRALSEDEYEAPPELPKQLIWDDDADALLKQLLRSVPTLFRSLARRKVTRVVEELAGSHGRVGREQVIRGYILSSPRITRGRNRKPLVEAGIDVERYRADWDAD